MVATTQLRLALASYPGPYTRALRAVRDKEVEARSARVKGPGDEAMRQRTKEELDWNICQITQSI